MPWGGYNYDTMAADLNDLLTKLDLRDVTLVGFSMGGGEVARCVGRFGTDRISENLVTYNKHIASFAQPYATQQCITAFSATDFRDDLRKADVPALFVHGDADQIVPLEVSAKKAAPLVEDSRLEVIEGAPHGLNYTHTETLNELLLDFLGS